MKLLTRIILFAILGTLLVNCSNDKSHGKIDTYENLKDDLKGFELQKVDPKADIEEFEMEVNNGGLNQYFFNASGQNCFETLRELKRTGKLKTAKILEQAIIAINPHNLSEQQLIEKLRKREVNELDNDNVNGKLNKLNDEFYKYPDGALQ